jgi:hypothetical protein
LKRGLTELAQKTMQAHDLALEAVAVKAADGVLGCGCCSDKAAEDIRSLKGNP